MKKADEIIDIVEKALLRVNLSTHLEICKGLGGQNIDPGMLRIRVFDELIGILRPQIEDFVESNFFVKSDSLK